jgi:hypothetical protein
MKRALVGLMLVMVSVTARGEDPCAGKVAAVILAYDRDTRQGAGLLFNQCGRPVKAELLVLATNRDGFMVARLRTEVQASATPLSVIQVELPFVQSAVPVSGYAAEVASISALDDVDGRRAAVALEPLLSRQSSGTPRDP